MNVIINRRYGDDMVTIKKIQFRPGKAFRTMLNDLEVQSASKTLDEE